MLFRSIRAFNPAPGAFCEIAGERVKILAADILGESGTPATIIDERMTIACGAGAIRPTLVQRQGKAPMEPQALLRSEEHTSELQSLMRIPYAVFSLNKQNTTKTTPHQPG